MRPRLRDLGLPRRVYVVHGSYWFRPLGFKSVRLTRVDAGQPAMLNSLAAALRNLETPTDNVAAAVAQWKLEALSKTVLAAETRKTYENIADALARSLGAFQLAAVDTPAAQQFLDHWLTTPRMGNEVRKVARRVFDWAVRRGQLKVNPFTATPKFTLAKRNVYIPDDALRAILDAMVRQGGNRATHNGVMNRAFIELAYLTGQRAQEVRTLRWVGVETLIRFRPSKTSKSSGREVDFVLTDDIQRVFAEVKAFVADRNAELLEQALKESENREQGRRSKRVQEPVYSEYVLHRLDGKPFQQTGLRAAWRRAIALTKFKDSGYTIKDIRPKALTDTKKATGDMTKVQEMAAHSSITTTEGYMRDKIVATVVSPLKVPKSKKLHPLDP